MRTERGYTGRGEGQDVLEDRHCGLPKAPLLSNPAEG